jgi:hypothetical protein
MATNNASSNKGTHSRQITIKLANKSSARFIFWGATAFRLGLAS